MSWPNCRCSPTVGAPTSPAARCGGELRLGSCNITVCAARSPSPTTDNRRPIPAMNDRFREHLAHQLSEIRFAGLYKGERVITSPQDARIEVAGQPRPVVNLCANNYLGLAEHPAVLQAAH